MIEQAIVPDGYKSTEVGVIPEDWYVSMYEDNFNLISGMGFKKSEYSQSGVTLIRIDNVSYGVITWDSVAYLPKEYLSKYKNLVIYEKDILLALNRPITNDKLKMAMVIKNDVPSILYQRVGKILFLNKLIDKGFAFYILTKHIKMFVENSAVGTDQPFISTTKLKKCLIPLPPNIEEQKAIANALSDVDALISSLEKLIAKKQAVKTATMQQLLTGKKRFPGFGEGKGYKQTELGEIPEDWEVATLGVIAKINMGQSPSSNNYNDKGVGLPLVQGNADIFKRQTIIRNYTSQITKTAQQGDLILSVRAPVGEVAKASFYCCIGRGVCAIQYKNDYLYHWLIYFEKEWSKFSKGSTFDSINSDELKNIQLLLPIGEEQAAIATVLSDMDSEVDTLGNRLSKTQQIKQGMMQELLTGKTRLI